MNEMFDRTSVLPVILALGVSMLLSFGLTPLVKRLAYKIGAVDVPKDRRRMHSHPIPRLGGLAIFVGFVITVLLFAQPDRQLRGILLGACLIVAVGVVDDSHPLGAGIKFILQIVAALIAVWHGVVIQMISNPLPFIGGPYWDFGIMAVPITVIWIVAVTNSVNLIDGLDGLADGVSTIAALTMLIIALLMGDLKMAVICAALVGACVGFIPYNRNPAKIFMGDTGATFLGYMLATVSVTGLFKLYAMISFIVPFIILGFPIYDTASAFTRRILKGQNPMKADRSHTHHKLIDMGMNQKQAVATLYLVAIVLGLCAVMIVSTGYMKVVLSIAALAGTMFLCLLLGVPIAVALAFSAMAALYNSEFLSVSTMAPTSFAALDSFTIMAISSW